MSADEVVFYPLTLWLGALSTPFPAIDAAEGTFNAGWFKLGTEGARNYDDSGVQLTSEQTIVEFVGANSTLPRAVSRSAEGYRLSTTLVDLSTAQYAKVMDDATVTTVAARTGVAGQKSFTLVRGLKVPTFAVLARGISPEDQALAFQVQIDAAYQSANPSPQFQKGGPSSLQIEFTIMQHQASDGIEIIEQTAAAL